MIACDSVVVTKISERSEKLLEQRFFRCSLWNLDTLSEGLPEMQDLHFLFVVVFFSITFIVQGMLFCRASYVRRLPCLAGSSSWAR